MQAFRATLLQKCKNKLVFNQTRQAPRFTARTHLGLACFPVTARQIYPNATEECVSDQGDQRDVDTNHMEKVSADLILCI